MGSGSGLFVDAPVPVGLAGVEHLLFHGRGYRCGRKSSRLGAGLVLARVLAGIRTGEANLEC